MANLGSYLFEAEGGEDIIANDGSNFFSTYAKQALSLIQTLKSLPLSLGNAIYPNGYEEDLIQLERRNHFDPKEWIMPAFSLDEDGNLSRILLIHSSHKEEGYVYQVKYKSVIVSFYRGFSIREFPNEPILSSEEFLESIGIKDEGTKLNISYSNLDEEDEDSPIIEIVKPTFSGFKKKKILNLGGKAIEEVVEDDEEEDDEEEEELQIEVHKSAFQASNKKKIANLGNSFGIEKANREAKEEEEGELHIEVERPSFNAGNGKKPKNLNASVSYKKPAKKIEKVEPIAFSPAKQGKIKTIVDEKPKEAPKETHIEVEKPAFSPVKKANLSMLPNEQKSQSVTFESVDLVSKKKEKEKPAIVEEENEWGSIDIFKLKPQVYKGERGAVKAKEFSSDFLKMEACEKALGELKNIRVSKKCVFAPKVWENNDPSFALFRQFDYSKWEFLACTFDKDDDIIYALLSNKAKEKLSILVSFKHHEAHIVGISLNGIALDDRALPYLSFTDLKKMVSKSLF